MVDKQVDILIIGGGLIGATLMLALKDKGYSTLLIEAHAFVEKETGAFDARTIALSPASVRILEQLQVWPLLINEATPIEMIHVSSQHQWGSARLQSELKEPLGMVVEMQAIHRTLSQLLQKETIMAPARLVALDKNKAIATIQHAAGELHVQAKLVVAADGANSAVRGLIGLQAEIKDYEQQAIVANIGLTRAHRQHAYERFTVTGSIAMLPISQTRAALIWALPVAEATQLMALNDTAFLQALQKAFGYRLGRLAQVGQRMIYPLRQVIMQEQIHWPCVFLGNAAHTLHPIAAQGFNLGLRDVATLAQCIVQEGLQASMLVHYQQMRSFDQKAICSLTDGLVSLFRSRLPGMQHLRNLGLMAFDNSVLLKKILARYARGFAGITPDLVCGISLEKANSHETIS